MSRLNKSDLEVLVARLRRQTNKDYTLGNWNGYWHIYNRTDGEMIISGSTRECYDHMQAYLAGIQYAVNYMGASMFSV